jgi:chromosome segregation ATPase
MFKDLLSSNIVCKMSSKTKNKRNTESIIKNGTATSILSACDKPFITDYLTDYRDKYNRVNNEYEKSKVKLEQMGQLRKDNDSKLIQLSKKNDTIKELHIIITQLKSDIKILKETTNDRGDYQRLEGKLKKKDHEIEELKKQINQTKINHLEHLENKIRRQNEQIKTLDQYRKVNLNGKKQLSDRVNQLIKENEYLKEGYGKFNVVDESLSKANQGLKEENDKLKEDNEALIQKLDEYKKISTQLFDLA